MTAAARDFIIDREAEFSIEELFFSQTDERGVILSGNTVFQRVSGYDWDDLIGAPHKLIRHPDMPKTVFWLFWERIQKGLPIGAYVKNRARDGSYYWVFAIVTPVEGGYLSVRLKPTSPVFDHAQALYASILQAESAHGFDAEAQSGLLMSGLEDLGFRDYPDFMASALLGEMEARDTALGRSGTLSTDDLRVLLDASGEMVQTSAEVVPLFSRVRGFPINLRIQATKQKAAGEIFGVISTDYARFCRHLEDRIRQFMDASVSLAAKLCDTVFLLCTARFQTEMVAHFEAEGAEDEAGHSFGEQIRRLRGQAAENVARTREQLEDMRTQTLALERDVQTLEWMVAGLDMTRTIGTIETARLEGDGLTLAKMMDEAEQFQGDLKRNLARIGEKTSQVVGLTERFLATVQAEEDALLRAAG